MKISLINAEPELGPLCRSYVCAAFDVLGLQIRSDAGVHAAQLLWAVGVMSDHRPHYLGAWRMHDPKDALWRGIASDLEDRGVERLSIVIGPDPVEIQAAMAPRYLYNAVLQASATLAHPEIESTLSGHRKYVESALEITNSLSLRLKRVVVRRGPFADAAAAAALLRRSADRYITRDWPEPSVPVRAPRSGASIALTAAVS